MKYAEIQFHFTAIITRHMNAQCNLKGTIWPVCDSAVQIQ